MGESLIQIISLFVGLIILLVFYFIGSIVLDECKSYCRKIFFNFKNSKRYNSLYGQNNWKVVDYSRKKIAIDSFGSSVTYAIREHYKIVIINKSNCPRLLPSTKQRQKILTKINIYETKILYQNNKKLYQDLIDDKVIDRLKFHLSCQPNINAHLANFKDDPNRSTFENNADIFEKQIDAVDELSFDQFRKIFIEINDG